MAAVPTAEQDRKPRTIATAYGCWLLGLHYFYLGDRNRQLLYWATLAGLGTWALRDAFRMPFLVEVHNQGGHLASPLYAGGRPPLFARLSARLLRPAAERWVALDFETATADPASVCEVGYSVLVGDVVESSGQWRVRPPRNRYDEKNTSLHGIGPADTAASPDLAEIWPRISELLSGGRVLLHWAKFDSGVLQACTESLGLAVPAFEYLDTVPLAKMAFPGIPSHRLPLLARVFGIPLDHHGSESDARAVALVAVRCRRASGLPSLSRAGEALLGGTERFDSSLPDDALGGDNLVPTAAKPAAGHAVVGRLAEGTTMPGALLTHEAGEFVLVSPEGRRIRVSRDVVSELASRGLILKPR